MLAANKNSLILLLILLIGFGIRILHIDNSGIWLDEKISLSESNGFSFLSGNLPVYFTTADVKQLNTFQNVIHATINDDGGNGILYILNLHYWQKVFGSCDFSIRMLSLVFNCMIILVAYCFSKLVFNSQRVALITALLIAVHPLLIDYAQEARPYSMATLFSLLSTLFFYKSFILADVNKNEKYNVLAFTLFSLCALLTHYLTAYIFVAQGIYFVLFVRRSKLWRAYTISWLSVFAIFIIWLFNGGLEGLHYMSLHNAQYIQQLHILKDDENSFVLPSNFKNIFSGWIQILLPASGNTLQQADYRLRQLSVLLTIPVLLVLVGFRKSNHDVKNSLTLLLLLVFSAPVWATLLAVIAGHTISFQPAYVIFTTPFVMMLIAIGFEKLCNSDYKKWYKLALTFAFVVIIGASFSYHYFNNNRKYSSDYPNPYSLIVTKINQQAISPSDTIVYPNYNDALLSNIYFSENVKAIQLIDTSQNKVILYNKGIILFDFQDGMMRY